MDRSTSRARVAGLRRGRSPRQPGPPSRPVTVARSLSLGLLCLATLMCAGLRTAVACVDITVLDHSAGNITRYFNGEGTKAAIGLLGIRGTAWFLSPTAMVTAEHVAAAMELSDQTWTEVELVQGRLKQLVDMRIHRVAGTNAEKIAVLELRAPFSGARALQIRPQPVAPEEQVVSLVYPGDRLRFVYGRFVEYGETTLAGTALLEMYDGNDRLALDHGASGAPVLDCAGRVVAVVSNIFTQTLRFPSREIRVSTAWGSPNVVSVPIQVLGR